MKKVLLAVCGLWLCGAAVQAQNYSIDWFAIAGGGGTSTGGVFTVTGTIGQADGGHMSGGNFTLEGGFWAIIAAVQTPGAPTLRVVRTTTNTIVLAWPEKPLSIRSLNRNAGAIREVRLLGEAGPVSWKQDDDALSVQPPGTRGEPDFAAVYEVTFDDASR